MSEDVKHIRIILEDLEYKRISKKKGEMTWKELFLLSVQSKKKELNKNE